MRAKGVTQTADAWRARAVACRAEQRMVEAEKAIAKAAAIAPDDRLIAFLHAQSRYELGLPAVDLFTRAAKLWPENLDVTRNHALALASEGARGAAEQGLTAALAAHPDWLDGHRVLAGLRWTGGDNKTHDAALAAAARAHPAHQGLWLGWFSMVAQTRDWPCASAILDEAEGHLGETPAMLTARVFVAGETGDLAMCEALLERAGDKNDPFLHMARIRLALRRYDAAAALATALPLTQTAIAGQVWPYVSTCWRMLGDRQAEWLDGAPPYVATFDVALTAAERGELAELLRALHTAEAPYAEQSVRAGTQTDRSVLLRHEPILQRARAALLECVRAYVAALPPHDATHPLLSRPREQLTVAGSWSVRLGARGFNVVHSHPVGWISSAFYVALPDAADMGPAPAGHFHFGAPPPELGLDLSPYATIAPNEGQLVLFPSTMWHGTHPIAGGERLNIAFDIVPR